MSDSADDGQRELGRTAFRLNDQIGFVLRQVIQRYAAIFSARFENEVTNTQWAALAKLDEIGPVSQNHLGRLTVMDAATIKGVVDRLSQRGLITTRADPEDARRRLVALTPPGEALLERRLPAAFQVSADLLEPLSVAERAQLTALLARLC